MVVIVVALDDCTMSVTKAPQNAPDNGVAAALLSVARSPEPANALRPLVMTLMPSRNRPTPPRTEIVVDIRAPSRCFGRALRLAGQCRAHCRQFLLLRRVDLRVGEIEPLHRFHNRGGDNEPCKPLLVGGHHEPGRVLRCGGADSFFVCALVVAPELAFVHVRSGELPVLLGSVEALQKALLLFLARHVQEELEDDDSLTREV